MGVLEQIHSRERRELFARFVVGRAPSCDLVLSERSVSGLHASLTWRDGAWYAQDLGSRNGTRVDGARLEAGQTRRLATGSTLDFGLGGERWSLADARPPGAFAERDGARVAAAGELLALPDEDAPEVLVYRAPGGRWVVERDAAVTPAADRMAIDAGGGGRWTLHLPTSLPRTYEDLGPPQLGDLTLTFAVSMDEEHVRWSASWDRGRADLGTRTFNYILLTLARERLEAGDDLPESARGWCYQDELADRMQMGSDTLKVYLYRARRHLAAAGIDGAAGLIERRSDAGQIRLGTGRVVIQTI